MKTFNPAIHDANELTINYLKETFPVETAAATMLTNNQLHNAVTVNTHAEKLQHAAKSFHFSMFTAYKLFLKNGAQGSWEPLAAEHYFFS